MRIDAFNWHDNTFLGMIILLVMLNLHHRE